MDDSDNNKRDNSFLETIEFKMPDDGYFRLKHVVTQFLIVLSDFNKLCYTRD
jgi:hypothetical protein